MLAGLRKGAGVEELTLGRWMLTVVYTGLVIMKTWLDFAFVSITRRECEGEKPGSYHVLVMKLRVIRRVQRRRCRHGRRD